MKRKENEKKKKKYRKRLAGGVGNGGSLYQSSHPERAFKLGLLGLVDHELATAFGVSLATVSNWKNDHPEFKRELDRGKNEANSNVVHQLYKNALGYEIQATKFIRVKKGKIKRIPYTKKFTPNTTAAIYFLNNRTRNQQQAWSNRQNIELSGTGGGAIELTAGNINTDGLDMAEIEQLINLGVKLEKNKED